MTELHTERLVLRQWREGDLAPFAAMNADARVLEHFPARLTRAQSDALAGRARDAIAERGWGLWAVEATGDPSGFIGFVGLAEPYFEAHFTPAVEIGWRLAHRAWGRGYATEGARAAAAFAFEQLGLAELVSFTVVANQRSRRVMEKLGMTHDPADDFDHPALAGHPLQRHVLYRLAAPDQADRSRPQSVRSSTDRRQPIAGGHAHDHLA